VTGVRDIKWSVLWSTMTLQEQGDDLKTLDQHIIMASIQISSSGLKADYSELSQWQSMLLAFNQTRTNTFPKLALH
jgi:hypothetical protein